MQAEEIKSLRRELCGSKKKAAPAKVPNLDGASPDESSHRTEERAELRAELQANRQRTADDVSFLRPSRSPLQIKAARSDCEGAKPRIISPRPRGPLLLRPSFQAGKTPRFHVAAAAPTAAPPSGENTAVAAPGDVVVECGACSSTERSGTCAVAVGAFLPSVRPATSSNCSAVSVGVSASAVAAATGALGRGHDQGNVLSTSANSSLDGSSAADAAAAAVAATAAESQAAESTPVPKAPVAELSVAAPIATAPSATAPSATAPSAPSGARRLQKGGKSKPFWELQEQREKDKALSRATSFDKKVDNQASKAVAPASSASTEPTGSRAAAAGGREVSRAGNGLALPEGARTFDVDEASVVADSSSPGRGDDSPAEAQMMWLQSQMDSQVSAERTEQQTREKEYTKRQAGLPRSPSVEPGSMVTGKLSTQQRQRSIVAAEESQSARLRSSTSQSTLGTRSSNSGEKCSRCGKTVYAAERIVAQGR